MAIKQSDLMDLWRHIELLEDRLSMANGDIRVLQDNFVKLKKEVNAERTRTETDEWDNYYK